MKATVRKSHVNHSLPWVSVGIFYTSNPLTFRLHILCHSFTVYAVCHERSFAADVIVARTISSSLPRSPQTLRRLVNGVYSAHKQFCPWSTSVVHNVLNWSQQVKCNTRRNWYTCVQLYTQDTNSTLHELVHTAFLAVSAGGSIQSSSVTAPRAHIYFHSTQFSETRALQLSRKALKKKHAKCDTA